MSDALGSSLHSVIRRWLFNNIYSNDNSKVKETDLFTHNSSGSLSASQILTRLIHPQQPYNRYHCTTVSNSTLRKLGSRREFKHLPRPHGVQGAESDVNTNWGTDAFVRSNGKALERGWNTTLDAVSCSV